MNTAVTATETEPQVEVVGELDTLLDELNFDDAEAIEEEAEVDETEVLDAGALRDLDLAIERTEAYESQDGGAVVATTAPQVAGLHKKTKGAKRVSGNLKPRAPRDLNAVASEFFVLEGDVAKMDTAALDAAKVASIALMPTQVKIAEKFENLFAALSAGKAPSVYVTAAFTLLDAQKTMTSADLIAAYKLAGLGEGTARSQTGQIMALFAAVKIADRSGQTLTLRPDSVVAGRIRDLSAGAAPTA